MAIVAMAQEQTNGTRYGSEPFADVSDLRHTLENERRILCGYNEWELIM
jgi:hypothetical protein